MIRLCMWCRRYMGIKPGKGYTHGICEPCERLCLIPVTKPLDIQPL